MPKFYKFIYVTIHILPRVWQIFSIISLFWVVNFHVFKIIFEIYFGLMIALQYWFDICHTSPWISHRCTCVPCLLNLPLEPPSHLPPLPTPIVCYRALVWVPCVIQQIPVDRLFSVGSVCFHVAVSMHPTFSFLLPHAGPHRVHKSVLCVCVSTDPLQIAFISTVFLGSIYVH